MLDSAGRPPPARATGLGQSVGRCSDRLNAKHGASVQFIGAMPSLEARPREAPSSRAPRPDDPSQALLPASVLAAGAGGVSAAAEAEMATRGTESESWASSS